MGVLAGSVGCRGTGRIHGGLGGRWNLWGGFVGQMRFIVGMWALGGKWSPCWGLPGRAMVEIEAMRGKWDLQGYQGEWGVGGSEVLGDG